MSGHGRDWAELASRHERLVALSIARLTDGCTVTAGWTELASRNERLVDPGDPHFRLTSPARHAQRRVAVAKKNCLAS
jgi:hypothetical protein